MTSSGHEGPPDSPLQNSQAGRAWSTGGTARLHPVLWWGGLTRPKRLIAHRKALAVIMSLPNLARLWFSMGAASAAAHNPHALPSAAAVLLVASTAIRLGALFVDPSAFRTLQASVIQLQAGSMTQSLQIQAVAMTLIRGANDVCTIFGLVLSAAGLLVRSSTFWWSTPSIKTQTLSAIAVAAVLALGAFAVAATTAAAEFGVTVLTGTSARTVQGGILIGLLCAGQLLEAGAIVTTVLGWATLPIDASRPLPKDEEDISSCSTCECASSCCGACLPGCDGPGRAAATSLRIPGGCLPRPALAVGLFGISTAFMLAVSAFPSVGNSIVRLQVLGTVDRVSGELASIVTELTGAGRVGPATLTRAADGLVLAAVAVAVVMVALRMVVAVPSRCLGLRDGPSQLAASVAMGATAVAVTMFGLGGMGRGGQWLDAALVGPAATLSEAVGKLVTLAAQTWSNLLQQAPELARPAWWLVLGQFGLLVTAGMLAMPSAMGLLVVAGVYWSLALSWGDHPLQHMLEKPGIRIL